MRKKPYPRNSDIEEAILYIYSRKPFIHPDEFPEEVKRTLKEKGFYTGLVTVKRIWRVYEEMIKKKRLYDFLLVTEEILDVDRKSGFM